MKLKLRKKDDANNKIKNDIRRQQSMTKHTIQVGMTKHTIQVGIVKLNEYKVKLRQYRNLHSKVFWLYFYLNISFIHIFVIM